MLRINHNVKPLYAPNEVSELGFEHAVADMLYGDDKEEKTFTISADNLKAAIAKLIQGKKIFKSPERQEIKHEGGPAITLVNQFQTLNKNEKEKNNESRNA